MNGPLWSLGILGGMVLLAGCTGGARAQAPAAPVQPAAVVNGEPIAMADVEALVQMEGPTALQLPESKRRQKRLDALAMLIDDLLMQQFLRQNGPRIDPAEVVKQTNELEEGLRRQGKKLQEFLRESNQTEAQLRNSIVNMLQWREYVRGRITESKVSEYYKDNKAYFDGVTVRASHIVIRVSPNAGEAELQAARDKLQALRRDIVDLHKIDFAEAAKKYSQCPSAPHGGDIGFFTRKWMVDETFAKAAFALQEVGDVSGVVQTDYGMHLIKLTERKAGQPSDYEKIKEAVRDMCIEDLRQALLAEQRKKATIKINMQ